MDVRSDVLERFLRYVRIDTQSKEPEGPEDLEHYPSTEKQKDLGRLLVQELREMGLEDAEMDEYGYVMATLPSNTDKDVPVVGFISHVDTAPAAPGTGVEPMIHENYAGGPIHLPKNGTVILPEDSPELFNKAGHTIITSSGDTLLGADDKAGVSEIMTMVGYLLEHPEIKHGKIRIAFTVDEEIGRGVDFFDIAKFGASYAYTVDGETVGVIETETFCADGGTLEVKGVDIHPGFAKGRMVNALAIASEFVSSLPRDKAPESTEGREGYLLAYDMSGTVASAKVKFIVRDFEEDGLKALEDILEGIVAMLRAKYPRAEIKLDIKEQYRNMRYYIEKSPEVVDNALEAARRAGLDARLGIIRGGTDGSRLSAMGLPTPNIYTGGHNFHSPREWISVEDMEVTVKTLVELASIWAEKA